MKFHKFIPLFFFLSFCLISIFPPENLTHAGINEWTAIGPEGTTVFSLVIDPKNPETIYAGTSAGVFKSVDGAVNWSPMNNGLPNSDYSLDFKVYLAVNPVNPNIIYAGVYNRVFKSTDGGANWNPTGLTTSFGNIGLLVVDPKNSETIFTTIRDGHYGSLYKSTDGGASWYLSNHGLGDTHVLSLAIDPGNPNTVYAGCALDIFKSIDGGTNWVSLPTFFSYANSLVIDPKNPNIIFAVRGSDVFKSINGGAIWNKILSGVGYILTLAIDPVDSQIIYIGTDNDGVFKSIDGGNNWNPVNIGMSSRYVSSLAINPIAPDILYAGVWDGVFKSTNSADSWKIMNKGLPSVSIATLAIDPSSPKTTYAGTNYGVFKSTNGGSSWNPSNVGLPEMYIWTLAINPIDPSTIYTEGGSEYIFKSTSGGSNWSPLYIPFPSYHRQVNTLAMESIKPNVIYAGAYEGIYKSIDGGNSWEFFELPLHSSNVNSLAINPLNPRVIYAVADGRPNLYKSTNGGITWKLTGLAAVVVALSIDPTSPDIIYAGGEGVFKSTDGGDNWTPMNTGLTTTGIWSLVIDPLNPNIIYAGTVDAGVFKSINGGLNWIAINSGLTDLCVQTLAIDPVDPRTLYVGTYNGVFKIDQAIPSPPTNLLASDGTYTDRVEVSWLASPGATSYKVYRATSFNTWATKTLLGATSGTLFNDMTTKSGRTYYYWVKASNSYGTSTFSSYDGGRRSNGPLPPAITVLSPNGGDNWTAGSTQMIRWTYSGNSGSYVKIELLKGGVVNRVLKSLIWQGAGEMGFYNWTIPANQTPGTDYRVRVTRTSNGAHTDMSDSDFTIAAPTITVVSPNSGETWTAGSIQTIRWTYTGNPGSYVKIELLKGGVVDRIIKSRALKGSGGSRSHNWHIPLTQAPGSDYQIRVTSTRDGSITDISYDNFTILGPSPPTISVISPNGGETLTVGSIQTIQWSYHGNPGYFVRIELLKAGSVVSTISYLSWIGSGGSGSYDWFIPSTQEPGRDYQIKVTSIGKNTYTGISDSSFTINHNLFNLYVNFPVGSFPEAVAIGDVNGDGRNDVVMTTSYYFDPENDYHIFVFLQNSSGGLNPPIKYPTNSSYTNRSQSIDIGDVNHDGRADIVVGNCGSNIEVFIQNSSGGLDPPISYPTVNSCSIKIADLNNDGLLDVVGIGGGNNTVDILFQNRNGTLSPPITYGVTYGGYAEVDVGDVNHDGLSEIIVMSNAGLSANIGVLYQGAFGAPAYYYLGGNESTQGVAIGDINGDNLQDIVVTYGGNQPRSKIGVFRQNSTGTLQPAASYDSYDIPEAVVIADVNNDGKKDIVVAHGGYALGVYLQGTGGTLMSEELYLIPASHHKPQGLAVGDINGDWLNDVVIADYNYGLVVLYNSARVSVVSPSGGGRPQ